MPENDLYEIENISSIGITLPELLEYYRVLSQQ